MAATLHTHLAAAGGFPITTCSTSPRGQDQSESIEMTTLTSNNHIVSDRNVVSAIWKAAEAPRTTFTLDGSKFYLPEGPLSEDSFWVILPKGERGTIDRHGPRSSDTIRKVRIKKKNRGVTYTCGSLVVDFHSCRMPYKCVIGNEQDMVSRLQTDSRFACQKLAASMADLLWDQVQNYGGIRRRLPREIADSLDRAADALFGFLEIAGRFIQSMRQRHQGGQRAAVMPLTFRRVLLLLGKVKWHRIHRAVNAVQCLEKAFRRYTSKQSGMAAQNFVGQNMLGMLGWRLAPNDAGRQKGALPEAPHSLKILSTVDCQSFKASEVEERMASMFCPTKFCAAVHVVKDWDFCVWTFAKVLRILSHRRLACDYFEEARWPGPGHFEGHIHTAHLEMMKTLPWVETIQREDHVRLRVHPIPGIQDADD